jgi:hypothetical protein
MPPARRCIRIFVVWDAVTRTPGTVDGEGVAEGTIGVVVCCALVLFAATRLRSHICRTGPSDRGNQSWGNLRWTSTLSLNADRTQILTITDRLNNSEGPKWFQSLVQFVGTQKDRLRPTYHAKVNEPRTSPGSPPVDVCARRCPDTGQPAKTNPESFVSQGEASCQKPKASLRRVVQRGRRRRWAGGDR